MADEDRSQRLARRSSVASADGRSAKDWVQEEGGSPALATWVGRIEGAVPVTSGPLGFWSATYARFARHRGSVLAGGLAFFALLSLVPAVLSLASVIALVYDPAQFAQDLRELLVDRPDILDTLDPSLESLAGWKDATLGTLGVAGLIGLAVSLYAASRFVYVGRQVLDVAFELEPQPPTFLSRGIAVLITLVAQVLVVVGVVVLTLVPRALELIGIGEAYGQVVRYLRLPFLLVLVYLTLTLAMRFGTRARRVVGWLNPGAAVGTAIVLLGTVGLGWYLTVSATYSQMVALLGGVIALQLWLYVIGVAIVLAAEIEGMRHGFRRRDRDALQPSERASRPA